MERARARGARRGCAAARARRLARGRHAARGVPARAAPRRGRPRAAERPRRQGQRRGLPRRLRERRARPARAPPRDRRGALAARGAAARASPSSSSATTSTAASSSPRGRRGARRAHEGPRRQPDPVRQLDARVTSSSGSAGSGATSGDRAGGVAPPARRAGAGAGPARVLLGAVRARPPARAAARDRDRRDVRSDVAAPRSRPFAPSTVVAIGPSDEVPLLAGKDLVDGAPGGVRLRALRLPVAGDRGSRTLGVAGTRFLTPSAAVGSAEAQLPGTASTSLRRMTTIEQTGAEEVAWDLSDLYAGATTRASRATSPRPRPTPRPSATATTARSRARRRRARRGDRRARADRGLRRRALYYAHLRFSTNMADPARGALVARLGEKAAASRRSSSSSGSSGPRSRTTSPRRCSPTRRSTTGATGSGRSACSARTCSRSPRRRSSPRRPSRASRRGRGSTRRCSARSGSTSTARTCRSRRRWRGSTPPTARAARTPPRRSPRRSSPASARARSIFNTILVDKWIDDRLRGYPTWIIVAQPRERDDRRGRAGARRRGDLALRRAAALLPAQGKLLGLDRLEHYDRFAPVADDASKTSWDEARRVVVDAYARLLGRGRRDRRAVLRRQAGSTRRCGPTSATARSARPTCRACTRTCS